jgi:hypothetical protein
MIIEGLDNGPRIEIVNSLRATGISKLLDELSVTFSFGHSILLAQPCITCLKNLIVII